MIESESDEIVILTRDVRRPHSRRTDQRLDSAVNWKRPVSVMTGATRINPTPLDAAWDVYGDKTEERYAWAMITGIQQIFLSPAPRG